MIRRTPGPTLVKLLRVPAHLYDWQLGWIVGHRFLRLTHVGHRSGRHYQTMLEVIGRNPTSREGIGIAGLGRSANWYRNLLANDAIEVAIGRKRFTPVHRQVSESDAASVLADYERTNASSSRSSDASSAGWSAGATTAPPPPADNSSSSSPSLA